jgi:glycosyltransferase involved in cell wall biosynthesis
MTKGFDNSCWQGIADMPENSETKIGPLVSVLVPTFNRPRYLAQALVSALHQSYRNLQIIIVNDGGEDVSDVVDSFNDPRVVYINRRQNRGKAFSLNEALTRAEGKYIAYLDDDDLFFPNHIEILVDALENKTDCQVAYTDLYKVYCRITPDGSRQAVGKIVEVSRDFDRFLMLYFNHVLHVSLMHHRDLLEKTGPYNEQLSILIDWDITRRLAFFTDFYHSCEITGEYYSPVGHSDRISIRKRKDINEYTRNVLTIRTTRPIKPWPKIKDLSIIFSAERLDKQAGGTIGSVWQNTFYPYRLYLPLPQADFHQLNTEMPNIIPVAVDTLSTEAERIDAALDKCDGEYIAIVPSGFAIGEMSIENPLCALINSPTDRIGFELEEVTDTNGDIESSQKKEKLLSQRKLWGAVVKKDDLLFARKSFPNLTVQESLTAAGIVLRTPAFEELPFQFDILLQQAMITQEDGNWAKAAQLFQYLAEHHHNQLWMKELAAKALFNAGAHNKAAQLSSQVNQLRPTVETLLLEAKVHREKKNFPPAIELLKKAEQILEEPILQQLAKAN